MQTLSVSALTNQIKSLLETSFSRLLVEGELSRITYHNSGHVYFTLKDARSTIRAVMFRGNASRLRFRLEEGMKVVVDAALTLYSPRGEYQLNCFGIEPYGQGALALAFEQLKNRLMQKGYFAPERKKPLPKFPQKVALITSATGAALQDMLRVAKNRYPLVTFDLYDVLVQGERAADSIAQAISFADSKEYDVIVVSRGGGSLEDLWAFNEERVATAIYEAKTPIISAVGHEIDTVISDFVADLRAATPSNAIELLLPDKNELLLYIDTLYGSFERRFAQILHTKEQTLRHLYDSFERHSMQNRLTQQIELATQIKERLDHSMRLKIQSFESLLHALKKEYPPLLHTLIRNKENALSTLENAYRSANPKLKSKKGFAQIVKDGKITDPDSLDTGQEFELQTSDTILTAKVIHKRSIP